MFSVAIFLFAHPVRVPSRAFEANPSGAIACRIETLDAPRRLSFCWGFPDIPDTWVDIRLRRIPGGTHVRLTHSGWDQFEDHEGEALRGGMGRAWHTVALPALKAVTEGAG